MRLRAVTILVAVAALVGSATAPALASRPPGPRDAASGQLTAQIRYTTGGIPHILAHNWPDLGFGYGYAFAKDNICTMANDYVTVEAQRSRYFGPKGSYVQRGNGFVENNLESDIYFQQIIDSHIVQHLEQGLNPDEKQLEGGYVKGYNAYLAHVGGAKGVTDPTCRGKPWVKPITLQDSYLRFYQLMLESSSDVVISGITEAAPPAAGAHPAAVNPARTGRALAAAWRSQFGTLGSNAVAIGSAGTRDHRGLLLGNPHFPWLGPERFYQAQLTIPGQINVTGASLYGVPLILIGHNENVAWSHTVSTAFRFTPFQLTLVKGHPTEYLQNGKAVAMTQRKVTVMAKQADGKLAPVTHTLWWTRYGPVFNSLEGQLTAVDHHHCVRLRRRQRRQPRPGGQHLVRLRPRVEHPADPLDPEEVPGHPLGQHDRHRPGRPGPVRRHRRHPARDQRRGEEVRHRARQVHLRLGRAADPERRGDLL